MLDATHTDAPAATAGPPQDQPGVSAYAVPRPSVPELASLLVLVRWIIDYALDLAATIHQRAARPEFRYFAQRYRNGDLIVIILRIKRGLMLAAGLEQYLEAREATGRELGMAPLRVPAERKSGTASDAGDAPDTDRAPRRTNIIDLPLDRLPTAEEIAEELRHRPVGAVLVDICRDLGLVENDLPPELARILRDTIMLCGGRLATLHGKEFDDYLRDNRVALESGELTEWLDPNRVTGPAACTGPP